MIGLALGFAYGCFGLAMLCCLYRVVRAPGLPDRLLALANRTPAPTTTSMTSTTSTTSTKEHQ